MVRAAHSHTSRTEETQHKSYTPPYILKLIKQKTNTEIYATELFNRITKHFAIKHNANVKKELSNYTNENWMTKKKALSTQDNILVVEQKFLKNKRSVIPALNCSTSTAVTDDQKANILADSIF
ncbi:hypothetical protein TNCV_2517251 [Trichonephila clavipes]|nr:hypothetical protein TNCV_2517251 [Trichonephila clavipes]